MNFADHYQDEEFKDVSTGKSTGSNLRDESDYEDVSTLKHLTFLK